MQKHWLICVATITLTSCIIGHEVSIINHTKEDKNIRIIYPADFKLPISDTLQAFDIRTTADAFTSRDYYRYPVKIPIQSLDTTAQTYLFQLKAGYKVILENTYPNSPPGFGQLFIINDIDTIPFVKGGARFKKKPRLGKGGSWIYRIENK